MNSFQRQWWEQADSDHRILVLLRLHGAGPCHRLHYLQMVTEKLAKAYFWRSSTPPPKHHSGFVTFMRALGSVPGAKQQHLAATFEFKSFDILEAWISRSLPLAYELERLAVALAQDGPNPEYPWPHHAPVENPARHRFAIWNRLTDTAQGRQLIRVIQLAVERFPTYA